MSMCVNVLTRACSSEAGVSMGVSVGVGVSACVLRELVQLTALLLVGGLEFLVLHPETFLLQHDLLVETGRGQRGRQQHGSTRLIIMSPPPWPSSRSPGGSKELHQTGLTWPFKATQRHHK